MSTTQKFYAIVDASLTGPAFGAGLDEQRAWEDSDLWADNKEGLVCAEVTAKSFRNIMLGNADEWERKNK